MTSLLKYLFFLSDQSTIIDYPCHLLTHSCLEDLIDVALACEGDNSKLVEVVSFADVDAEKCVEKSLVQTWKLKVDRKVDFLFRL